MAVNPTGASFGGILVTPALVIAIEQFGFRAAMADAAAFGLLVGLSTAIGQFTCVVGPGLLGLLRDLTGGYGAALALCVVLELAAAAVILYLKPTDLR